MNLEVVAVRELLSNFILCGGFFLKEASPRRGEGGGPPPSGEFEGSSFEALHRFFGIDRRRQANGRGWGLCFGEGSSLVGAF